MALRKKVREMDDGNSLTSCKVWDERRLRMATDAAGVALWTWHIDTDRIAMDDRAFDLWGLPPKSDITFGDLAACVHPPDLEKVRSAFNALRDLRDVSEVDFRILRGDELRWVSARGRGDEDGIMYGVFLDVTSRKRAEKEREVITQEMHHRIKNLFSLSSALAAIAAKNTRTKEEMFKDLTSRLQALAAAHNLIVPRFHEKTQSIRLEELLTALLQAYALDPSRSKKVSIQAPEFTVGERSITSLAMIIRKRDADPLLPLVI